MSFKEQADNLGLEEDEFEELVVIFVETSNVSLDELRTAIDKGDVEQAAASSHSIKGAAGNMGFQKIFEAAKEIEANCRNGHLENMNTYTDVLSSELERIAKQVNG